MSLVNMLLIALMAQATASVEGVVVKIGSGEPVAGARVELHPERNAIPGEDRQEVREYTATTGENGKFVFGNVAPATYRLIATRSNFVPGEYGQRSPTTQGIPLELTPDQKMTGIQLAM